MTRASGEPISARQRGRGLTLLILVTLAVPVIIPILNARQATATLPPAYLPVLEGPRLRASFDADRIPDLRRLQPGDVVIGDSMAGRALTSGGSPSSCTCRLLPCCNRDRGSAFWYLALKNWVIASGVKPRMILIFFRDTNLTDLISRRVP